MYEDQTENVILKRMLDKVPTNVDKREGSVIYDASMPAAIEFMLLYAGLDFFYKNTFGDTADREHLIERALERGLKPEAATYARCKAKFTPETLDIPIGSAFSYDDVNYIVAEKVSAGIYFVDCDTSGTIGNKPAGTMIANDYISGLRTAELLEVTIPGENEEDTEVFRQRYLASFDSQAFGGNIQDYKEKIGKIQGIAGCKVYPIWKGGGSVRIVFMTSEYKPPTVDFVATVQEMIDPVPFNGQGVGIAPIGHTVTVEGVQNSAISIAMKLTAEQAPENYQTEIEGVIDAYFEELNVKWPETKVDRSDRVSNTGLTVRVAQIESRILGIAGVIDVENLSLNSSDENLVLGVDELAVRGELAWLS